MRRSYRAAGRCLVVCSATLLAVSALAVESPIHIVAPAAPGTGWDQLGHAIEEGLLGSGAAERVEVVNVPGAGGTVGLAQFVRDPGPGEPLLITGLSMVSGIMINRSPVGLDRVAPIARLASEHFVLAVAANSALETAASLAEAMRIDPEKVALAGGPMGGVGHIAALLTARAMGADVSRLVYIPYLGSAEALAAVEEGRVAAAIISYPDLESDPKTGPIRILAVTAPTRLEGVDAPTLKEVGMDVEIANWRGIMAPLSLSAERQADIADLIATLCRSPHWAAALKRRRWEDSCLPAPSFAAFLAADQARVKEVLKAAGLLKRATP